MKKNYFKSLMQVALLLAAPFVVSSCDDIIGQEDNPVASYVQWKNDPGAEVTMKIGDKKVIATATAVSSAIIAYESSDTAVATIDPVNAEITAKAVGETTISAVISGMSTNGRSVFEATKISFKLIVKDGKASLTRAKDAVIEYTANKDSIIDLSKLFTAYPEATTSGETDKSTVTYSVKILNKAATTADKYETYSVPTKLGSKTATSTFKVGPEIEKKNYNKAICDTLYVIGQITSTNGKEYTLPTGTTAADLDIVMDTVKVIINKSIAFINAKGEREILTADKYEEVDLSANSELKAGTYYVTNSYTTWTSYPYPSLAIKGDVNLIFKNTINAGFGNIDDQTDGNAALNIFGEAIPAGTAKYAAWTPGVTAENYPNAITNFKEINLYAGTLNVNGLMKNVKDVNVFKSTTLNANSGLSLTGKLTINDGTVNANRLDSDTETGFAVIGDVVLNKGSFYAENTDYRAVKGSLTAGEGLEFVESNDPTATKPTWTKITGTTSNARGVKSQAKK